MEDAFEFAVYLALRITKFSKEVTILVGVECALGPRQCVESYPVNFYCSCGLHGEVQVVDAQRRCHYWGRGLCPLIALGQFHLGNDSAFGTISPNGHGATFR